MSLRSLSTGLLFAFSISAADREPTLGTWQGTPSAVPASRPRSPASQHRWLILSTGRRAHGRGNLGKNLNDVCFWSDRIGVAVGDRGAYRTDDGGFTWTQLRTEPVGNWSAVALAGPNDIWIAGNKHPGGPGLGFLRHSTDGGQTWQKLLEGDLCQGTDICLTPAPSHPRGHVWIAGGAHGVNFHSPDRGKTWKRIKFGTFFRTMAIDFPGGRPYASALVGYAVGLSQQWKPLAMKTTDSGQTWRRIELPQTATALRVLCFVSPKEGWIGGDDRIVLHTRDGGASWERRHLPDSATGQALTGLMFFRTGHGWASVRQPFDGIGRLIYQHTLYFTPDGGHTWYPELGGSKDVHALWSNGPGTLWAVGNVPGFIANDLVAILDDGK